ncbi:peptidoglycan hydrolase-like protein with peptidoglycan-binding domain [Desulfohalotomaculum tongense]|uniref:L,D-transpeptidase family protein n=1 Tax=Desulforadius tongensis TaxID=1216062 RepID=UPI0019597544|nr:peptidoglycan-binding protein [Desulforadius tongensis]MBM7855454.1 peptidoglycan hydrolase-like protein with peptidoglycan-binding domain [Desulforadius tongensis]
MKTKILLIVICTAALFFLPPTAEAGEYHLCPITCQKERILTLQQPYLTGPDVKALQRELMQLGYYKGKIDGIYGLKTAQAVSAFQADQKLNVTGTVTGDTWEMLASHLEQPAVKETPPPPDGDIALVVDTINRTLTLMANGEPYKQFHVAVGTPDTPSPVGIWRVSRKAKNWGTGFGTRWLGLNVYWGMYGIHGTNKPGSIGSYASHGCIRMHNSKVEQLYPWVPTNTPVYIIGNPFGVPGHTHRILCVGEKGADVAAVQAYLKRQGYYNQKVDGIFGPAMERAVFNFRKDHGLLRDNRVDREMFEAMGL